MITVSSSTLSSCGHVRMCTITASPSSTNAPWGGSRLFLWELDSTELLSHIRKAQSPERPRFWDKRSPCHLTRVRRSEGRLLSLGKWQPWVRSSVLWRKHQTWRTIFYYDVGPGNSLSNHCTSVLVFTRLPIESYELKVLETNNVEYIIVT